MTFEEMFPGMFEKLTPVELPQPTFDYVESASQAARLVKRYTTPEGTAAVERLVAGLQEASVPVGIRANRGGMALSIGRGRVGAINVPLETEVAGLIRMGGSPYAAAQTIGPENLRTVTEEFVEQALQGLRGEGSLQEMTTGGISRWLGELSESTRETMQAIQLSSGQADLSRAYYMSQRVGVDLKDLSSPTQKRYVELKNLQEYVSKGGQIGGLKKYKFQAWDPKAGQLTEETLELGPGQLVNRLEKEQEALLRDITAEVEERLPQRLEGLRLNQIGQKPGAALPYLRESKGTGTERIYLNLMPPDEIAMLADRQKLSSGLHQTMKIMPFTREQLGAAPGERITPVYTKLGYGRQREFYGQALGEVAEDVTTQIPTRLGLFDPGRSQMAQEFIERYLPDSALTVGRGSMLQRAAQARWQGARIDVSALDFRTSRQLSHRLTQLQPGQTMPLRFGGQPLTGAMIGAQVARESEGYEALTKEVWSDIGARGERSRVALGLEDVPGVRQRVVDVGAGDIIESVTRKGDTFQFQLLKPRLPGSEVATPLSMGAGEIRTMAANVADLSKVGASGMDALLAAGDYGMKFGSQSAATVNTYLGHIFHRMDRDIKGGRGRTASRLLAKRLGLQSGEGYVYAAEGTGLDESLFQDIYNRYVATDAQQTERAATAVEGVIEDIAEQAGLTPQERVAFRKSLKAEFVPFSDLVQEAYPDYYRAERARILEATRKGAGAMIFEGQPVQVRTIEEMDKLGPSGMNLRLSELDTFQSGYSMLPEGPEREAYERIYKGLVPDLRTSPAGSDLARTFGQFMTEPPAEGLLREAPTYTLDDIVKQFASIPDVAPQPGTGRILRPQDLMDLGKPTMLAEPGQTAATLRQGGFYVQLPKPIQLYLKEATEGGLEARAAIETSRIPIPGFAVTGKETWSAEHNKFFLQKPSSPGQAPRIAGDIEALMREVYETASTTTRDVSGIQQRAQLLIDAMQKKMPGRDSLLREYFTEQGTLKFSGQRVPLIGAGPKEALTVGVTPDVFERMPGGREALEQGLQEAPGVSFSYPGFGRPHAQVVNYRLLQRGDLGLKAGEVMPRNIMAFGSALSHMTQRDFDWDPAYGLILDKKYQRDAETVIAREMEDYQNVQRIVEEQAEMFKGLGGKPGTARAFREKLVGGIERQGSVQETMDTYLRGVRRQKSATPLAHVTFRSQREVMNLIGTEYEALSDMLDKQTMEVVERVKNIAGKSIDNVAVGARSADWMYWAWGSGVYDVLKKKEAGGQLEQFQEIWKKFGSSVSAQQDDVLRGHFREATEELLTGGSNLQDILQGGSGRNVVGTTALWTEQARIRRQLAQHGVEQRVDAGVVRKHFIEPMADWLADLQYTTRQVRGLPETSYASLGSLFGDTMGRERYDDFVGAFGKLMRATGIGSDPRWVIQDGAAQMLGDIHAKGPLAEHTAAMLEEVNKTSTGGAARAVSETADSLATQGRNIVDRIWKTKVGKVGMIAGGAVLGYQLLKGLVGGDGEPEPVFPGGGPPLPPRPLLDTAAQRMQQAVPPRNVPVRVSRPDGMRTQATASAVRTHDSPYLTMGYSSSMPAGMDVQHAEMENPEITSWQMQQYMAARMRSSF